MSCLLHRKSPPTLPTPSLQDDQEMMFYDNALYVLFDLPDFIFLSTYMLLGLLWAETLVRSRMARNESALSEARNTWLIAYIVCNIALYSTQLIMCLIQ